MALPFLFAAIVATGSAVPIQSHYDAIVDGKYRGDPGTLVKGSAMFRSIGEAIASVPIDNGRPFVILIRRGRYNEKLIVDRPNVRLVGESRDETVITHGDSGDSLGPDGKMLGTWGSFTLKIVAPDFLAENLTVENSFDYPANARRNDDDPLKVRNPQAVAVMTDGASDRATFRNCVIRGYQDTLFVNAGRHYFVNCRISGHVDFIFGAGTAVFENCDVVSRNRANKSPTGYVTAPSTLASNAYGLVFVSSRLIKDSADIPPRSVRLGRPWHPNANREVNGSAVFIKCYMDDHIGPEGYARISSVDSTGQRVWFEVGPESRFFEYGSIGPGAFQSPERPVMDDESAARFSIDRVLDGWDVSPYRNGSSTNPDGGNGL